ncbi:MAG: hypothetical protein EOM66_00180 [Clostridia bacterium]|nr:LuxR C-terminal-related transcriptional regulator [Candidatus Pelethousia sp.]NCB29806.1 hypothetical protein [Clostridia bacterium]
MAMLREAFLVWRTSKDQRTTSLQLRLFAFFSLFILALGLALYFVMAISGVFDAGATESRVWVENELEHLTSNVSTDFGKLSLQATFLAGQLSADIDAWLEKNQMSADALQKHPEQLESLLSAQMNTLLSALKNNKCSGAYIILDATVNPEREQAADSRAGIFLKRTEPNAINLLSSKIHYLRGPASIARENGIGLLGQWQLEFDVRDADFYSTTLETARKNKHLSLSRLYYWSDRVLLTGNSESGLLLCAPLISRDATVYGICGMEVSSMLFKLEYSPENSHYPRIFSTLAPMDDGVLDTDAGLIAGNSYLTNPSAGQIAAKGDACSGLFFYRAEEEAAYIGAHGTIKLYPKGSPYQNQAWSLAVLMPAQDWYAAARGNRLLLYGVVLGLLGLSLLLAVFTSRRYIRPVVTALDRIKSESHGTIEKTKIAEIDDLLEYLAAQDEHRSALAAELEKTRRQAAVPPDEEAAAPNLSAYEAFVHNIGTLSTAERAVFNLYMKGHTAKEISELLYISINTIKTHNKRIYTKLNVTSRKELMVYVQMMGNGLGEEAQGPCMN